MVARQDEVGENICNAIAVSSSRFYEIQTYSAHGAFDSVRAFMLSGNREGICISSTTTIASPFGASRTSTAKALYTRMPHCSAGCVASVLV